jgi:flagellar hook-associated protein 3 FlgL
MRISTNQISQQATSSILDNQARAARSQQQLASGQRMLSPSDDPPGTVQALDLRQVLAVTEQYQRNADAARSRLELTETVLAGSTNLLQRVRQLAVSALNDTVNAPERAAIAVEVRELLNELLGQANARDANGEYVFGGYYKGAAAAFVDSGGGVYAYNGDQGQRALQIGPTRQVAIGENGDDTFMRIPASAGGVQSVFATLEQFIVDLNANAPSQASLNDLDNALEHLLEVRARAGSRLNGVETQKDENDAFLLQLREALSGVEDLDYAEAVTRFNQQLLTLQAAQQTYVKMQGLSLFNFL